MSATARSRVLSGYRQLFRARKSLFNGDTRALIESKKAIRHEFDKNRNVATSGEHFEGLLVMIDEAADMLRNQFVQGKLNPESGRYQVKIQREHVSSGHANLEPVTQTTVDKMQKPMVETTCTSQKDDQQSKK